MSTCKIFIDRNTAFAAAFQADDLPVIPKLRTVVISCADARVDPEHIFNLQLGDAVVIRNNGGRVTQSVIEELAAMAFMVAKMDAENPGPFEVIIMHHTQCGAERFADPKFQQMLKLEIGVDVSATAIHDHTQSLREDIEKLRNAPELPAHVIASGFLYDVKSGKVKEVSAPAFIKTE